MTKTYSTPAFTLLATYSDEQIAAYYQGFHQASYGVVAPDSLVSAVIIATHFALAADLARN